MKEEACRVFITDLLGSRFGATVRYYDLIHPKTEEERDPDEIANKIRDGLREI